MADLKVWFLTWRDGINKTIMAPDEHSAINIGEKGIPSSIHEIDINNVNYKIYQKLHELKKGIDELMLLIK